MLQRLTENVRGVDCLAWSPPSGSDPRNSSGNVGDRLGPLILDALAARLAGSLDPTRHRRVLSVGSVLHFAETGDIVWGSGINGKVRPSALPAWLDVRAVRGPYTRAALLATGIPAPELYGDPALLLPEVRPEVLDWPRTKRRSTLVVPNLNELERFTGPDVRVPFGDPWDFVRDIAESEFVTGTSLHALIIADALGVPSRPIAPEAEHPFKYIDHYAGTGRRGIRFAEDVDDAVRAGAVPPAEFDARALLDAFPADAWLGTRPPIAQPTRAVDTVRRHAEVLAGLSPEADDPAARASLDIVSSYAAVGPRRDGLTDEEATELGLADTGEASGGPVADDPGPPPTLSVVMPAHDVAPWIAETLDSVLSQDVDGLEVVVVDDHSTDGTRRHLERIAASDPRVRVVDAVSRGGGTARNIGIDRARGRYLVFSDADDLVPEGAYRAMVESVEASGSDIVFGDFLKFSTIATWSPTTNWPAHREPRTAVDLREHPTLLFGRACWNKVFRRSFWDATGIRYPDVPRSNDIVPMTTAYLAARTVDVIDDVVYLYRERPGTTSMTAKAESATSLLSYLDQELHCARMVHDDGSEELRRQYASLILDRDGWVHLTRFLRSPSRDRDREPEILDRFRALVGALDRSPERLRTPVRRLVWRLALDGSTDLAAAVCRLVVEPVPPIADDLVAWLDALRLDGAAGVDLLDREWRLGGRVAETLGRAIVEGDDSTDAAVVALARVIAAREPSLLLQLPELADSATTDDEELLRRFARTRALGGRVVETGTGQRVTAVVRSETGERLSVALFDERRGVAVPPARPPAPAVEARVGVDRVRLRRGHRHRIVAVDPATGRAHSTWGRPRTPEYDPFDAFLLIIDRRGVGLTPRRHWAVRGARKLARRVAGLPRRMRRGIPG